VRFLLDESVDVRLAAFLNELGHDATTVAFDFGSALSDDMVLGIALMERRVLITNDRDFGDLVFRLGAEHAGVILLRPGNSGIERLRQGVAEVLASKSIDFSRFLTVTRTQVRSAIRTPG
jgi:predicted nuclease of predicted toxin-antitoxin system